MESSETSDVMSRRQIVFLIVLLVDVLYVASSISISFIFEQHGVNHFEQPFLLTWISTSLFSVYLVPGLFRNRSEAKEEPLVAVLCTSAPRDSHHATGGGTRRAVALLPLYFALNYSFNASLEHTNVASCTTLSSSAGLWTALFSSFVLRQRITLAQVGSAVGTLLGVALLMSSAAPSSGHAGVSASATGNGAMLGNILSLCSAMLYGVYSVALKQALSSSTPMAESVDMVTTARSSVVAFLR